MNTARPSGEEPGCLRASPAPASQPLLIALFQGDLSQLGRVVLQGGFSVWISHKRAAVRMKEMARFKPMQRHVFLYEHAMLFCKRRDDDSPDRTPFYSFKSCLRVNTRSSWLSGDLLSWTTDAGGSL